MVTSKRLLNELLAIATPVHQRKQDMGCQHLSLNINLLSKRPLNTEGAECDMRNLELLWVLEGFDVPVR